jgi:hypothetical protein
MVQKFYVNNHPYIYQIQLEEKNFYIKEVYIDKFKYYVKNKNSLKNIQKDI